MVASRQGRRTAVVLDAGPATLGHLESTLERLHVDVVAAATALESAVDAVADECPDLVLIGVSPATIPDVAALVAAAEKGARPLVLALGDDDDPVFVRSILALGLRAYVVTGRDRPG
jgi:AmiR/NasT family two-component response regulator